MQALKALMNLKFYLHLSEIIFLYVLNEIYFNFNYSYRFVMQYKETCISLAQEFSYDYYLPLILIRYMKINYRLVEAKVIIEINLYFTLNIHSILTFTPA